MKPTRRSLRTTKKNSTTATLTDDISHAFLLTQFAVMLYRHAQTLMVAYTWVAQKVPNALPDDQKIVLNRIKACH